MSYEKRGKKEIVYAFDSRARDIRTQLNEQLKCLDNRLDSHSSMIVELQEFYRCRAEIELDYSKKLDKLVKQVMNRHKQEKTKPGREMWPGYSTYTCWQMLLSSTKRQSKDHGILSDLYTKQMSDRFNAQIEDIGRIFKQCREIGVVAQEELLKVLNELQSAMKTYHQYHNEAKQAEGKLQIAKADKAKVEQHAGKTILASRRFKTLDKRVEKRFAKYTEAKMKNLKARNEYLLCLEATNAAIKTYFLEDLSDLIDAMDSGFHSTMGRAMMVQISAEENCIKSRKDCLDRLNKCVLDLDQRKDKQHFLELHTISFSLPKKFEFQAHKGDEVSKVSAQKTVQDELLDRSNALHERLNSVKVEHDEVRKTLESAETSLVNMWNKKDYDVSELFQEENLPPKSPIEYAKQRSDLLETEHFYIEKFRSYLLNNNLMCRLRAKYSAIQKALGDCASEEKMQGARPPSLPPKPRKRKLVGKFHPGDTRRPKLFGGSLEEYVEATGEEIPNIVSSSIRIINLYGLHHQGVFRVSGSQHDINEYKSCFEKGEDPLQYINDGNDINSVAGVLKLFFRELREPVFPVQIFDELIDCSRLDVPAKFTSRIKELLHMQTIGKHTVVVLRYLFAFLNHLSEYSDENMMDPYNLAICFGPTLLPIPPDRDQVMYQNHVNELVKNLILYQEDIFPNGDSLGGPIYEKCILDEREQAVVSLDEEDGEMSDDEEEEEDGDRSEASEEESELYHAVAMYDFVGRTDREISFKKGDTLVVYNQVSSDWWDGCFNKLEGLIPDKYIKVIQKDEDSRISVGSEEDKRRSTESLPANAFFKLTSALTVNKSSDALDKSVSNPNISIAQKELKNNTSSPKERPLSSPAPQRKSFPTGSSTPSSSGSSGVKDLSPGPLSEGSSCSSPSLLSRHTLEDSLSETESLEEENQVQEHEKSTDDLQQDVDSALEKMMLEIKSLEKQQKEENGNIPKETLVLQKVPSPHPKHTPDLVLDLPVNAEVSSPTGSGSDHDSPTGSSGSNGLSTAEVFAKTSQNTIKKASSMPRGVGASASLGIGQVLASGGVVRRSATAVRRRPEGKVFHSEKDGKVVAVADHLAEDIWQRQSEGTTGELQTDFTQASPRPSVPVKPARKQRHSHPNPQSVSQSEALTSSSADILTDTKDSSVSPAALDDSPSLFPPPRHKEKSPKPDVPDKPKPPVRAKPSVIKRPGRSPELLKESKTPEQIKKMDESSVSEDLIVQEKENCSITTQEIHNTTDDSTT